MRRFTRWQTGIALAGLLACGGVQAHGGLSMEKDFCKLRLGPYGMHFTGYQPEVTGANEFCEDIPRVGHTVVALDALDEPLRDVPIEVRIIRDTGDESNLEAITVFHLPPKRYPSGTVSFDHRFEQAGKFVGLVIAGERGEHQSRFPFSVAAGRSRLEPWLWAAAIIAGGVALFLFSERRRPA
jgi:hypothetical protein